MTFGSFVKSISRVSQCNCEGHFTTDVLSFADLVSFPSSNEEFSLYITKNKNSLIEHFPILFSFLGEGAISGTFLTVLHLERGKKLRHKVKSFRRMKVLSERSIPNF